MEVLKKLLKVQTTLKAPKSQRNTFGNYNYRNCEDILEAVKPILAEVNATVILTDELVQVGERYYVKATARFIDCDADSEECSAIIENTAFAREEENKKGLDSSQITGASSSYARKYALNGLFAIDDTKDSDATNVALASKEQITQIHNLNVNVENVFARYKVNKLEDLTASQAEFIINTKKKAIEEMK